MVSRLVSLTALLILCYLVDSGDGIECYQCNSYKDALCGDPFTFQDGKKEVKSGTSYLKPCIVPQFLTGKNVSMFCRKIYQNIRNEVSVIRKCGWIQDDKGRECYTTVMEDHNTEVCHCKQSRCNSANVHFVSLIGGVLFYIVLRLLI